MEERGNITVTNTYFASNTTLPKTQTLLVLVVSFAGVVLLLISGKL